MNNSFWLRMHGGATHFPIALLLASVVFDCAGLILRNPALRHNLRVAGFYSIVLAGLLSFGAVFSGLVLSRGIILGNGLLALHHKFVWPAFALMQGAAAWRLVVRDGGGHKSFLLYLAVAIAAALLMAAAGFWGGEMLLAP